jgi:hypothetical protein
MAVPGASAADIMLRAPGEWRACLGAVVALASSNPLGVAGVLPAADLGRAARFVQLFSSVPESPLWLRVAMRALSTQPVAPGLPPAVMAVATKPRAPRAVADGPTGGAKYSQARCDEKAPRE